VLGFKVTTHMHYMVLLLTSSLHVGRGAALTPKLKCLCRAAWRPERAVAPLFEPSDPYKWITAAGEAQVV